MKIFVKVKNEQMVNKVYKSITHVSLVLIVNRHVEEVISPLMILVNFLKDLSLSVLIRNIPYHERGSLIFSSFNFFNVEFEIRLVNAACLRGFRISMLI